MNKNLSQIPQKYESNFSLKTAGLPSGSIMTSRLIPSPSKTKPNQYFNQNRATDTQPISFNSSKSATDQSITFSHQTISDTYLNLSRKDIDDLLTALHTLAQYVHTDTNNQGQSSAVPHSESVNHTIEKSSQANNSIYHQCANRQHSLSTDFCPNYLCHPVEQLRGQERQPLQYLPCYQNYGSNIQPKQIHHYPRLCQPIQNLPSSLPLPSYLLDQLVSIDQNELIANVQMLPQHAYPFPIVQNNQLNSLMSIDSLNAKRKRNHDQTFSMGDQLILKKIDVATQWSLPISPLVPDSANSTNLTELTPSKTTIATNNSAIHPSGSIIQTNAEHELTKSETERFLISHDLPPCRCLHLKQRTTDTTAKHSSIDDTCMNISVNDSYAQPMNKKKNKPTPPKVVSKRTRYYPSRNASPTKYSRRESPSNRQLMSVIQSLKTNDLHDDSSFDFFDMDTTFSDRFFSDTTTTSEKSIC